MHHHLGRFLLAGDGADITFKVDGETFAAHRRVLAARSCVFTAELFGPMREKTTTCVHIKDMEAKVFKAMLHFIYSDSLPHTDDADAIGTAQHLLVAADRYNLERLKPICVQKLCNNMDTSMAATTLALAKQHGCRGLKEVTGVQAPGFSSSPPAAGAACKGEANTRARRQSLGGRVALVAKG